MSPMQGNFTRVGIVNRGEPAMRFLRALRDYNAERGTQIASVALYTDTDRGAPFVRLADEAVAIGPALRTKPDGGTGSAYTDHAHVFAALEAAGCDAVWPGWGFIAEDADFAEACEQRGIAFIGPPADAMRRLGDKIASKHIATASGVPMAPWREIDPDAPGKALLAEAEIIGYPLVVKASAGGGGRGIRVVREASSLVSAVRAVKAEVARAFGQGGVFLEACVQRGRHIEVQLVVGADGKATTLGLRDCTLQRRHQKVIEEAPSPIVGGELGKQLCDAAARLGEAAGYRGVGTVEFLVGAAAAGRRTEAAAGGGGDDVPRAPGEGAGPATDTIARPTVDAHFLEVNTRLQVEHTVTEAVWGVDLVHVQLDVARGVALADLFDVDGVAPRGHAIEVRINAEDPERGFRPSPGTVRVFRPPLGPGVRVDSGVAEGQAIAPEFDSMIAKVICWGKDRRQATARLVRAVRELEVVVEDGTTNKAFLLQLLAHPRFDDAQVDTAWLDLPETLAGFATPAHAFEALCAAAIALHRRATDAAVTRFFADVQGGIPYGFAVPEGRMAELRLRGQRWEIHTYDLGGGRWLVGQEDALQEVRFEATGSASAVLELGGARRNVLISEGKTGVAVEVDGATHRIEPATAGRIVAPAPALVVSVDVEPGQRVEAGERLGTLEAMKMEMPLLASEAGVVSQVLCRPNAQVAAGEILVILAPAEDEDGDDTDEQVAAGPARVARPLDALFAGGVPDPGVTDGLDDAAAAVIVADVCAVVEAKLLGRDVPPALLARVEGLLADETAFRLAARPERWRPVTQLLTAFADVEGLFRRTPLAGEGESAVSTEVAFHDLCRRHAEGLEAAHEGLRPQLLRVLGRYGLGEDAQGPALREALWRVAVARSDAAPRHKLVSAVVRVIMALHEAGLSFIEERALHVALSKVSEVARPAWAFVRDNARQARYLLFRREPEADDVDVEPLADAIVEATPGDETALRRIIGELYFHALAVGPLDARDGGALAGDVVCEDGAVVEVALVDAGGLDAALTALGAADKDLHVFLAGSVGTPPTVPAMARRVTVSWTADGCCVCHATWAPGDDGAMVLDERLGDIHPERARRLELWRFEGFALERLPATAPVLAFKARAHDNPHDERIIALAEVRRVPRVDAEGFLSEDDNGQRALDRVFAECLRVVREAQARRPVRRRYFLNRVVLHVVPELSLTPTALKRFARRLEGPTRGLGLQKVVVQARVPVADGVERRILTLAKRGRHRLEVQELSPSDRPIRAVSDYHMRLERARRLGVIYPYEIVRMLSGVAGADAASTPHPDLVRGRFVELDLDASGERLVPVERALGLNSCGVVCGLVTHATRKHPEGMTRVWIASDATRAMGALAEQECRRILAALHLAEERGLPIEWLPVSAGARIAMDSGTENLDWTARVLAKIVSFTQDGGEINVIVAGVNVGAQSYWNAEATMLMHTRGILILTQDGSMVLTGKKALEVSGGVAAEDEIGIGGFDRIMGPNGQAQFHARDLGEAYRILFDHYVYAYVAPGETRPRRFPTADARDRRVVDAPYRPVNGETFATVGEVFDDRTNPGRKKPFAIREIMRATIDQDGGFLERFAAMEGAETAVTWDAHVGGHAVALMAFESRPLTRRGTVPLDGPDSWAGGTLFPNGSKKIARALNQASGNRPAVVLANLSGFDGSPESMRRLQLEYGAEIGRAVVNFRGPLVFVVVGRYHGGAYVVFSKALNAGLTAMALEGSFASVIGGAPAAAVVFPRDVRRRAEADPRAQALRAAVAAAGPEARPQLARELEALMQELVLEHQGGLAREFDRIHDVHRAVAVGSLDAVIAPERLRPAIIEVLDRASAAERRRSGARLVAGV